MLILLTHPEAATILKIYCSLMLKIVSESQLVFDDRTFSTGLFCPCLAGEHDKALVYDERP